MLKKGIRWAMKASGLRETEFHSVFIERNVVQAIIKLAKNAHPNEFTAFLQGNIRNRVCYVKGVVYEHYHATDRQAQSALTKDVPLFSEVIGTVHSHPSFNNLPTSTDKQGLFQSGLVNIIICKPYTFHRIAVYDTKGIPMDFTVVERVSAKEQKD
jgi:proteasome lid subunit RPN8/RPN11